MDPIKYDSQLTRVFARVGKRYGYEEVEAAFHNFRDFKVRWQRSHSWAVFSVSDYLRDAPEEVVEDLADSIFTKIGGEDRGYPQSLKDWLNLPSFVEKHQPMYLRRSRTFAESDRLSASYDRLFDAGLIEHDPQVRIGFGATVSGVAECSVLMKVIIIDRSMSDAPDSVIDYLVYRKLCALAIGFDPEGTRRQELREMWDRYPDTDNEVSEWLANRGILE